MVVLQDVDPGGYRIADEARTCRNLAAPDVVPYGVVVYCQVRSPTVMAVATPSSPTLMSVLKETHGVPPTVIDLCFMQSANVFDVHVCECICRDVTRFVGIDNERVGAAAVAYVSGCR